MVEKEFFYGKKQTENQMKRHREKDILILILRMMKETGELKMEKEGTADIYNQLIELIGEDNTRLVFQTFRGQQVTFPKRFYKLEYVINEVKKRYDGTNLQELAREFDYTDRHLRKLIFEENKKR